MAGRRNDSRNVLINANSKSAMLHTEDAEITVLYKNVECTMSLIRQKTDLKTVSYNLGFCCDSVIFSNTGAQYSFFSI